MTKPLDGRPGPLPTPCSRGAVPGARGRCPSQGPGRPCDTPDAKPRRKTLRVQARVAGPGEPAAGQGDRCSARQGPGAERQRAGHPP